MKYKLPIIKTALGLALELMSELVARWQLEEGHYLELTDSDQCLVSVKRSYSLGELVGQCDATALASDDALLWDAVSPQGRELV